MANLSLYRDAVTMRKFSQLSDASAITFTGGARISRHDEVEPSEDGAAHPVVIRAFIENEPKRHRRISRCRLSQSRITLETLRKFAAGTTQKFAVKPDNDWRMSRFRCVQNSLERFEIPAFEVAERIVAFAGVAD